MHPVISQNMLLLKALLESLPSLAKQIGLRTSLFLSHFVILLTILISSPFLNRLSIILIWISCLKTYYIFCFQMRVSKHNSSICFFFI